LAIRGSLLRLDTESAHFARHARGRAGYARSGGRPAAGPSGAC